MRIPGKQTGYYDSQEVFAIIAVALIIIVLGIWGSKSTESNKRIETKQALAAGVILQTSLKGMQTPTFADVAHHTKGGSWVERAWQYFDIGPYRVINPAQANTAICDKLHLDWPDYGHYQTVSAVQLEHWQSVADRVPTKLTVRLITHQQISDLSTCPWITIAKDGKAMMDGKELVSFLSLRAVSQGANQ